MEHSNQIITSSYSNDVKVINESSRLIFREHKFVPPQNIIDVHADYWSLGLFQFSEEAEAIVGKNKSLKFSGVGALYLPRFAIVEWMIHAPNMNWIYFITRQKTEIEDLKVPTVFMNIDIHEVHEVMARSEEAVTEWILNQENGKNIERQFVDHLVPQQLKSSIDRQFRQQKAIKEIQEELRFSPSYSSRIFKQAYGLSPVEYRNRLRVMQVSVDLLFKQQTIEQSQHSVGIEDSSFFHKKFKQHLNARPSQFLIQTPKDIGKNMST